jgi:hypothetical protein
VGWYPQEKGVRGVAGEKEFEFEEKDRLSIFGAC